MTSIIVVSSARYCWGLLPGFAFLDSRSLRARAHLSPPSHVPDLPALARQACILAIASSRCAPPLPLASNPPDHDTCWSASAHPVPAPGHSGAPPAPRSLPPAALWARETLGRILNNSVASQTRVHLCPHFHIPLAAPALPHSPESRWLHPGTLVRAPSPLQLWLLIPDSTVSRLAHDYPKAVHLAVLRFAAISLIKRTRGPTSKQIRGLNGDSRVRVAKLDGTNQTFR